MPAASSPPPTATSTDAAAHSALFWHKWLLVPIGSLIAAVALFFAITAPRPAPNTDIATLLAQGGAYNLSLDHLFDLTGAAMGLFRAPLAFFGLSMILIGPGTYLLRRLGHTYAANLSLAAASIGLPAFDARGPCPLLSHARLKAVG